MAFNWDLVITPVIMIAIILWIVCGVTKQTVAELIESIKDIINGKKDDALEKGEELLYYD